MRIYIALLFSIILLGGPAITVRAKSDDTKKTQVQPLSFREINQLDPDNTLVYQRFEKPAIPFDDFQTQVLCLQSFLKSHPNDTDILDNLPSDDINPIDQNSVEVIRSLKANPSAILAIKKLGDNGMLADKPYTLAKKIYVTQGLSTLERSSGPDDSQQEKWRRFLKMLRQNGVDTSSLENTTTP